MLPSTKCTHCHPIFWKQQKQHPMFLFFFSVPSSSILQYRMVQHFMNVKQILCIYYFVYLVYVNFTSHLATLYRYTYNFIRIQKNVRTYTFDIVHVAHTSSKKVISVILPFVIIKSSKTGNLDHEKTLFPFHRKNYQSEKYQQQW